MLSPSVSEIALLILRASLISCEDRKTFPDLKLFLSVGTTAASTSSEGGSPSRLGFGGRSACSWPLLLGVSSVSFGPFVPRRDLLLVELGMIHNTV